MHGLHWFRNDLRLRDNTALAALLSRAETWLPVFVLDPRLCRSANGVRVHFLLETVSALRAELASARASAEASTARDRDAGETARVAAAEAAEARADADASRAEAATSARRRDAALADAATRFFL